VLPWSLRSMADAPNCGAEEKIGHSGRDDRGKKRNPRAQAEACATEGARPVDAFGSTKRTSEDGRYRCGPGIPVGMTMRRKEKLKSWLESQRYI